MYGYMSGYDRAAADQKFLQLVIDNVNSDEVPNMTAWPYSRNIYLALQSQIRSCMTPPKVMGDELALSKWTPVMDPTPRHR